MQGDGLPKVPKGSLTSYQCLDCGCASGDSMHYDETRKVALWHAGTLLPHPHLQKVHLHIRLESETTTVHILNLKVDTPYRFKVASQFTPSCFCLHRHIVLPSHKSIPAILYTRSHHLPAYFSCTHLATRPFCNNALRSSWLSSHDHHTFILALSGCAASKNKVAPSSSPFWPSPPFCVIVIFEIPINKMIRLLRICSREHLSPQTSTYALPPHANECSLLLTSSLL